MTSNRPGLKVDKTYFIIIDSSRQHIKLTHFFRTPTSSHSIILSQSGRNIGFTFCSDFNFIKHISLACRFCFYHSHALCRIHCYISLSAAQTVATTLVTSKLDYCSFFITSHLRIFYNFSVFSTA